MINVQVDRNIEIQLNQFPSVYESIIYQDNVSFIYMSPGLLVILLQTYLIRSIKRVNLNNGSYTVALTAYFLSECHFTERYE